MKPLYQYLTASVLTIFYVVIVIVGIPEKLLYALGLLAICGIGLLWCFWRNEG